MKKNKVSIKDVALASGVSVATVSRIINNTGRFSNKTAEKVFSVANKLGYRRNKLAVSLRSQESNTIGILVPDITNEFFSKLVKNCEQELFNSGYSTIICNTDRSGTREKAYYQTLLEHQIDGLMIISSSGENDSTPINPNLPTIYIDRKATSETGPVISSDHYNGGCIATEYLLKSGHAPYLIMTKTKSSATLERVRGFKDVLKKNKINNIDNHIFELSITSDKFLQSDEQIHKFLSIIQNHSDAPGVFAINDNIAYMVIRAAKEMEIQVPSKLSVIGFDGTSYSEIASPKITTIYQDADKISNKACAILLKEIQHKEDISKSKVVKIPVKLNIKQSSV